MAQAKESPTNGSSQSHADFLSKLPIKDEWLHPLVLYKNYWLQPHVTKRIMLLQDSFKARPDDIILATNPKCGTTWLKALAFAITSRHRYDFNNHPLLTCHPHDVVPYIEIPVNRGHIYVETLPSPRLLATHMPLSLLPESIEGYGCHIVYICRDPKDAFVSQWHFWNRIYKGQNTKLDSTFNMFCEGFSSYGPFWDHCLEYWKESTTKPERVLFLKYEEMVAEPLRSVNRLATFLGVPFTSEEEDGGVPEEVVRLCSFEMLSGLQANQTEDLVRRGNLAIEKSMFFRRGKVGDWVNHISEEMGRKLDCIRNLGDPASYFDIYTCFLLVS